MALKKNPPAPKSRPAPDYPAKSTPSAMALLTGDARKYILERCSPVDFLVDIMNGVPVREVVVRNQVIATLPANLDQRIGAAEKLMHKILPDLKSIEARVTEPDTKKVDVSKLDDKELAQLERILTKSAS